MPMPQDSTWLHKNHFDKIYISMRCTLPRVHHVSAAKILPASTCIEKQPTEPWLLGIVHKVNVLLTFPI